MKIHHINLCFTVTQLDLTTIVILLHLLCDTHVENDILSVNTWSK